MDRDSYIHNIGQSEFFLSRTYGHYHILPCPKHLPYATTIIGPAKDRLDTGGDNFLPFPIAAPDIARDLVENEGLADHGCICSENRKPTAEELETARKRMENYYRTMLMKGDESWAKYGRPEMIDDNSRRAALYLGEEREWSYKQVRKLDCPGCGAKVLPGIARHNCGYVLDVERAVAGGMISAEEGKKLKAMRKKVEPPPEQVAETVEEGDEEVAGGLG